MEEGVLGIRFEFVVGEEEVWKLSFVFVCVGFVGRKLSFVFV